MKGTFYSKTTLFLAFIAIFSSLLGCSTEEYEPGKDPAPTLTYTKQTFALSSLTGGVTKEVATAKIFQGVTGTKDGYTIKSITLVSSTAGGKVVDKKLTITSVGEIVFDLVLRHADKKDVTLKKCAITISKDAAATLTFSQRTKTFSSYGSFTTAEILAGVQGTKDGYTLKSITSLYPTGIASVSGTAPSLSLSFTKAGTFTATIVLQHTTKADVTITGASFRINSASTPSPTVTTNLRKGYANTAFRYFYYPTDGKIYYSSRYDIYKMDLDGSNAVKIKDKAIARPASGYNEKQYVYVYNDWVYYNNYTEKKIYRMRRDGSSHTIFLNDAYGEMKAHGGYLYFLSGNLTLKRVKLDKSASEETLFRKGGYKIDFYIASGYVYFHKYDDSLWKYNISSGTETTLSSGQNDGYVFCRPDSKIYYRDHSANYGISKSGFDMTGEVVVKRTTKQINEAGDQSMNYSGNFFCYMNRDLSSGPINLYFVSADGTREVKLVDNVENSDWTSPPQRKGELKIIGNWIYYMRTTSTSGKLEVTRIKKDGTGKSVVKAFW